MDLDLATFWKASSYVVTLMVGVYIKQWLERKSKLVYWLYSATGITIENPDQPGQNLQPNTHTVVLQNTGRKSATNVRLGHTNVGPVWFQIVPSIHYEQRDLPGGGYEIVIDNLTPGRIINITYFYFGPTLYTDINTHIESDEGQAKLIPMTTQRVFPKWFNGLMAGLLLIGLVAVVYMLWQFVPWLWEVIEQASKP